MPLYPDSWRRRFVDFYERHVHDNRSGEKSTRRLAPEQVTPSAALRIAGIQKDIIHRPANGQPMWNSLWLSNVVLGSIASVFAFLAIALALLWRFVTRDSGIPLITSNHYSWTYGPTALLVIVVAFWRQVDYHCKAIAPWTVLRKEQLKGSRNLLLDYVSPIQVSSFTKSLSDGYYTVTASILGFVLLKLIVLVSTGLFLTAPTPVRNSNLDLIQSKMFDGSLFNSSSTSPTLNDSSLAYQAYGILAKGLAYPEGTYKGLAYETFEPLSASSLVNTKVTATVNAFIPTFECQSAPVAIKFQPANTTDLHPSDFLQLQFPECQLLQNGDGTPVYALNPQVFKCPPRQLSPLMQRIICLNETDPTTADNWQLLTLADLRYNQTLAASSDSPVLGDSVAATAWSTSVNNMTGIACRSTYTLEPVNVTYDYSQNPTNITVVRLSPGLNRTLEGFTSFDLGRMFTASLSAAAEMFGNVLFDSYAEEYPNTMFKVMGEVSSGGYEALMDQDTMMRTAESVFQQITVQILSKYLAREVKRPLQGQAFYHEERLQLNDISVWLMVSGFLFMTIIAIFILFRRARDTVPRDPEPPITTALLLQRNQSLQDILSCLGSNSADCMHSHLDNRTFAARFNASRIEFELSASNTLADIPVPKQSPNSTWWKPLSVRHVFVSSTILVPLVIIATLEVIQNISDRDTGTATVTAADSLSSKISTRYLPALVMLLSATLANSVDFTVAALAPYNALKSGASAPSVMTGVLGLVPPYALWVSIKNRYLGAALSTIAALIGSVLTIISSGLYTIDFVPTTSAMQVQRTDSFSTTWQNSVLKDSGAAVLISLTESSNLTFPQFTYDELALPGLQLESDASQVSGQAQSALSLQVRALRASLDCTTATPTQFNISTFYNPSSGPSAIVNAVMPLPPQCPYGGSNGNLTTIAFDQSWQLPFTDNSSFVAKLLDLHVGPFDPILGSSSGELAPTTQNDNPSGCPSLAFIYGYVDVNDQSQNAITTLICYQQIQQIPVNLSLTLPELTISQESPPVPDESNIALLASGPNGETAFSYRPELHMDNELSIFNQTQHNSTGVSPVTLDGFFQGVLFGRSPMPHTWLSDPARVDDVKACIQAFYRRYMAQAISANMRVPTPAAAAELISGVVTTPDGVLRVHQNTASKLALQILLGVMAVCVVLVVWLAPLREVVPHNPCTIAGVMALWAGSRFCSTPADGDSSVTSDKPDLPDGAVFMSDKTLLRSGALDGWAFKLGWWDMDDGSKRYGIDLMRKQTEWGGDY
ncbi:hypothetical protein LTS15_007151 [Exophiala xenobiotica]|nr:hypothetical protein LTS15_007151 [Exophiala xenobiotica]